MASYAIQLRRGTATEHGSFTGLAGEITVNTTRNSIHVHDGSTAGGTELATKASVDGLTVSSISDVTITTPSSGQVLQYNGSAWVNATDEDNLANNDTGDLAEGSNLYYTDARADARITAALIDEDNMASNSATRLPSQQSVKAYVDAEVAGVVDAAPGALDTLNELAAALGDDANFSTTVTNSIATKLPLAGGTMSGDLNMGGNDITNAGLFNGTATSARYADLAERYEADAQYDAGTVVVFGGDKEITMANGEYDHRVAGVVSSAPAYMMNSEAGDDTTHPYVALTGRVPCKVTGTINKGDILTTSAMAGHAMAGEAKAGHMIGKALENFDGEAGVIEVLVNLM